MKLIAHRGGNLAKENSLESFIASARAGADAVECDIRKTKDGIYVIYHDEDLSRLAGRDATVSTQTYNEMKSMMKDAGHTLLTFDELAQGYTEKTPILLHIKLTQYDTEFAEYIVNSKLPLIVGVVSLDMLKCFSPLLSSEKILAFLPSPSDAEDFYKHGAGILRLWEQWLDKVKPADIKELCPNAEVFIMACNLKEEPFMKIPLESMEGSPEFLEKCLSLGADGVLLNDITMAVNFIKDRE